MTNELHTNDPSEVVIMAETIFANRNAARTLAASAGQARASLRDRLDLSDGGPIPIGLLRLRRHAARASSIAYSQAAAAASTADETVRAIGSYRLELVIDDSAMFILISVPDGEAAPSRMTAFSEAPVQHVDLELPKPIAGTIQMGFDLTSDRGATVRGVLQDPFAEICLE